MLLKGDQVIGKDVFTIEQGKRLSSVKDLIYDPHQQRVLAFIVHEGGLFSDATLIPIDQVKSIGEDAVIIQSEDVLKKAEDFSTFVEQVSKGNTYLTGTKVLTEDGQDLGTVKDIYFDPQTGVVEQLEVSQGLQDLETGLKQVSVEDIMTIGEDATIVRTFVEQSMEAQSDQGGVQGILNEAVDTVQQKVEQAKENFEDFENDPETQRKLEYASIKADQLKNQAAHKAREAKESASQRMDELNKDYHQTMRYAESQQKSNRKRR